MKDMFRVAAVGAAVGMTLVTDVLTNCRPARAAGTIGKASSIRMAPKLKTARAAGTTSGIRMAQTPTPTPTPTPKPLAGNNTSLNGMHFFPGASYWYTDVTNFPVHPQSDQLVGQMNHNRQGGMYAEIGSTYVSGMPYVVVNNSTPIVDVILGIYADGSDHNPGDPTRLSVPIPPDAEVESYPPGQPATSDPTGQDCHFLIYNCDDGKLYEMWGAYRDPADGGAYRARFACVFDTTASTGRQHPEGWSSADAAGLPIMPGTVRYDEVEAGVIPHALRITMLKTSLNYIPPAIHQAGSLPTELNLNMPMGGRVRLKASYDISGFSRTNQIILQALKTYGAIVADNGFDLDICGAPDPRWDDIDLLNLRNVPNTAFEVIDPDNWKPGYTVTGPATGYINQPATFTVALNPNQPIDAFSNVMVLVKTDGGVNTPTIGLTTPDIIYLSATNPTVTFTLTPRLAGAYVLRFTNPNQGRIDQPALTYTATAPLP